MALAFLAVPDRDVLGPVAPANATEDVTGPQERRPDDDERRGEQHPPDEREAAERQRAAVRACRSQDAARDRAAERAGRCQDAARDVWMSVTFAIPVATSRRGLPAGTARPTARSRPRGGGRRFPAARTTPRSDAPTSRAATQSPSARRRSRRPGEARSDLKDMCAPSETKNPIADSQRARTAIPPNAVVDSGTAAAELGTTYRAMSRCQVPGRGPRGRVRVGSWPSEPLARHRSTRDGDRDAGADSEDQPAHRVVVEADAAVGDGGAGDAADVHQAV